MGGDRRLAAWLVSQRRSIEQARAGQLGPGEAPGAGTPETEALRRFRSYALAALASGGEATPALEGLRVREEHAARVVLAWIEAAASRAGPEGPRVRSALLPLAERFQTALRSTAPARRRGGAPRSGSRRAVSAAIDRVGDAFLAVDTETADVADANPAAGALLGTSRDALIGSSAWRFIPQGMREAWQTELDAVTEGSESRRFQTALRDSRGRDVPVEASVTRFVTRRRTLALFLARPIPGRPGSSPRGFSQVGDRAHR